MNTKQLVTFVAAQLGVTKQEATQAVKAVLGGIEKGLNTGKRKVRLDGFGTFSVSQTKERDYVSPTGVKTRLPETVRAKFKAHADLHNSIVSK